MISQIREQFNSNFSQDTYQKFLNYIAARYDHRPPFKIAETPVFVPDNLKKKLFDACESITDTLCRTDFKALSQGAILPDQIVPGEDEHTVFLQMDFGICKEANGELSPQLIEVQGFPSLYFFQDLVAEAYRKFYDIPDNFSHLFNGLTRQDYYDMLRRICVGDTDPKEVVLLEVAPTKQVTYIDFLIAQRELGIAVKCVTDLKKEGNNVFYIDEQGRKVQVKKIINRVIFDELIKRDDLAREFRFTQEANVEWVGHPHWFFRISKHTLPILDSPYVPKSYFLNQLDQMPDDLENYVLKPLYSFAGTGVIININQYDIDAIKDPENYILQRKVEYAPVVETLDEPSKCEIRMLMLWEKGQARPIMVNNLARLSKGEMIGVRYNKNKTWVGGAVGFFSS
ncbi:MAG: hypothetical protein AAFV95_10990 [Bacteroidota bacterium]